MAQPTSIFHLKQCFLESQARLLCGELRPPKNWQDEVLAGAEGDLPQKVVDAILTKLNLVSRKHCRLVYSMQTMRRVAEQVEALYRQEDEVGSDRVGAGGVSGCGGTEVLRKGVDLSDIGIISILPEEYPAGPSASPADLSRYQTLRQRLQHASTSLRAQRLKTEYYSNLYARLEPFSEAQKSIQPNLVTRGGELDRELERMRVLALRLSVQIERAKGLLVVGTERGEDERQDEAGGEGDGRRGRGRGNERVVIGGRTTREVGARLVEVVDEVDTEV